jgi:hypothetical protein
MNPVRIAKVIKEVFNALPRGCVVFKTSPSGGMRISMFAVVCVRKWTLPGRPASAATCCPSSTTTVPSAWTLLMSPSCANTSMRFRYKPPHHFTYHVARLFLMTRVCEHKCFTESPTAIMLTKFVSLTLLQNGSPSGSNKNKPLFAAIDRALGSRSILRGLLFIPYFVSRPRLSSIFLGCGRCTLGSASAKAERKRSSGFVLTDLTIAPAPVCALEEQNDGGSNQNGYRK